MSHSNCGHTYEAIVHGEVVDVFTAFNDKKAMSVAKQNFGSGVRVKRID